MELVKVNKHKKELTDKMNIKENWRKKYKEMTNELQMEMKKKDEQGNEGNDI